MSIEQYRLGEQEREAVGYREILETYTLLLEDGHAQLLISKSVHMRLYLTHAMCLGDGKFLNAPSSSNRGIGQELVLQLLEELLKRHRKYRVSGLCPSLLL